MYFIDKYDSQRNNISDIKYCINLSNIRFTSFRTNLQFT